MPLVAHSDLPSFDRLREAGQEVLAVGRSRAQDIRELHIGFLNMMPDAALEATERQFMRMIGACNRIAQFYVHPFTIEGIERAGAARDHVARHYEDFHRLADEGLDALILTGANVTEADITHEPFWEPLGEVMDYAREQVCSTLMSCLASHAAFKRYHDIERTHLDQKRWGVYAHTLADRAHPLVCDVNTRFEAPHSRFNDVPRAQMEHAGLRVLVHSEEAGVLAATSAEGLRSIYLQGHPEYDAVSLLKEYKREVMRYVGGEREDYPPYPDHYFDARCTEVLAQYRDALESAMATGRKVPPLPESRLTVHNTWTDTGKALFNNWLGLVYQLTSVERRTPFMEGVDPADPLGLGVAPVARHAAMQ